MNQEFEALVEFGGSDGLRPFVPRFRYHLCDLSRFSETDLKGAALLRIGLSILKYVFSDQLGERLPEIFRLIAQIEEQSARTTKDWNK